MTDGDASPASGGDGIFEEFRLALAFLTILPVIDERPRDASTVAASFGWFPLVGFLLGGMICAFDALMSIRFGIVVRSALDVLAMTVLTGAIHLDGLADTADAIGAGRNRERALDIMRDSGVGTFGTLALIFDLGLRTIAIASMHGAARYAALFAAPGIARWAMVAVADRMIYVRGAGAGTTLLGANPARPMTRAAITLALGLSLVLSMRALWAVLCGIAITALMRAAYRRWLGGITGDLVGACGEIVEVAALLAMSI
jgi:adenosylcobinamide-GDP ribazoletransferase